MTRVFDKNSGGWVLGHGTKQRSPDRAIGARPSSTGITYCGNDEDDCFSDFVRHNAPHKERLQTRLGSFLATLAVATMTLAGVSSVWLCHIFTILYSWPPDNAMFLESVSLEYQIPKGQAGTPTLQKQVKTIFSPPVRVNSGEALTRRYATASTDDGAHPRVDCTVASHGSVTLAYQIF